MKVAVPSGKAGLDVQLAGSIHSVERNAKRGAIDRVRRHDPERSGREQYRQRVSRSRPQPAVGIRHADFWVGHGAFDFCDPLIARVRELAGISCQSSKPSLRPGNFHHIPTGLQGMNQAAPFLPQDRADAIWYFQSVAVRQHSEPITTRKFAKLRPFSTLVWAPQPGMTASFRVRLMDAVDAARLNANPAPRRFAAVGVREQD